jgi:hypothetical protein
MELRNILTDTNELARLQIIPLGSKYAHIPSKTLYGIVNEILTLLNSRQDVLQGAFEKGIDVDKVLNINAEDRVIQDEYASKETVFMGLAVLGLPVGQNKGELATTFKLSADRVKKAVALTLLMNKEDQSYDLKEFPICYKNLCEMALPSQH